MKIELVRTLVEKYRTSSNIGWSGEPRQFFTELDALLSMEEPDYVCRNCGKKNPLSFDEKGVVFGKTGSLKHWTRDGVFCGPVEKQPLAGIEPATSCLRSKRSAN